MLNSLRPLRATSCFFFSVVLLLTSCTQTPPASQNPDDQHNSSPRIFAITNVNIIPMTPGSSVIENAAIVIRGNTISSINGNIPDSAKIINGKGKWLIPGLTDMHVHGFADINFGESYPTQGANFFVNDQDVMTLYIANGVTTIFDLNARAENFGQRNQIIKGQVTGPRIALAALINGGESDGRIANSPSDGRQTVRLAKAEGYEFIKVYSQLDAETFNAIVDEARIQGMKVVGHIPDAFKGKTEEAFVPHFGMVAHAEEFAKHSEDYSDADIHRFAKLAKENGTWLSPTLIVIESIADQARSLDSVRNLKGFEYIHPLMQSKWLTANRNNNGTSPERVARLERMISFNKRLVTAFHKTGVNIVAGTDAGSSGVVWGFALHDELALLVEAGLSPAEALVSATRLPAEWLGIGDKTGTIEAGKFADLVLLDGNPLDDIGNTRKIAGVFLNGVWVNREKIDSLLLGLAARNKASLDKFEWRRR